MAGNNNGRLTNAIGESLSPAAIKLTVPRERILQFARLGVGCSSDVMGVYPDRAEAMVTRGSSYRSICPLLPECTASRYRGCRPGHRRRCSAWNTDRYRRYRQMQSSHQSFRKLLIHAHPTAPSHSHGLEHVTRDSPFGHLIGELIVTRNRSHCKWLASCGVNDT